MKENNRNNSLLPKEVKESLEVDSKPMIGEYERVWDLIGIADNEPTATAPDELDQRWASLQSMMPGKAEKSFQASTRAVDRQPSRSAKKRLPSRRVWTAAIAMLFLALTTGYVYWQIPVTYTAPFGETANVLLPDGSEIQLNSGSTLSYKRGFDGLPFVSAEERLVDLNGEAYFKVTPSTVPFRITTFNANIQVLGTQFNVKAWSTLDTPLTSVALASGRVQVTGGLNDEGVILDEPGESTFVSGNDAIPATPAVDRLDRILIWRENGFAVHNQSLRSVFAELELRFGVNISVQDEQILRDSLTILLSKPGSLEAILDDICNSKSLRYRPVSRGFEVVRP